MPNHSIIKGDIYVYFSFTGTDQEELEVASPSQTSTPHAAVAVDPDTRSQRMNGHGKSIYMLIVVSFSWSQILALPFSKSINGILQFTGKEEQEADSTMAPSPGVAADLDVCSQQEKRCDKAIRMSAAFLCLLFFLPKLFVHSSSN